MTDKATVAGRAFGLAHRLHVFHLLERRLPPHLSVLVYHRIDDSERLGFHGDPDLVSATPEAFLLASSITSLPAIRRSTSGR